MTRCRECKQTLGHTENCTRSLDHMRARLPSIETMKALADSPGPCRGCIEKERRLTEAISLIRRGVQMLYRTGWEKGETDDEWRIKARSFLAQHDMETEYLKSQERR